MGSAGDSATWCGTCSLGVMVEVEVEAPAWTPLKTKAEDQCRGSDCVFEERQFSYSQNEFYSLLTIWKKIFNKVNITKAFLTPQGTH